MPDRNDDNHANQMNPNNDAYWSSRGHDERPDDWQNASEPSGLKDDEFVDDAGAGWDGGPLSAEDY